MSIKNLFAAFLFALFAAPVACLAKPPCPENIISLTLASDEILVDIIGDRKKIAALTCFSTDPLISNIVEKARGIPQVQANLEQVISKSPDLVIVAGHTNPNIRAHLEAAGIKVLVLHEIVSLESIKKNIELVGEAVCEEAAAKNLVKEMETRIADARAKIPPHVKAPTVLFYGAPGFTVGNHSTINDIIESSGAINLPARLGLSGYSNISAEYVIQNNPDLVLTSSYNPSHPDFAGQMFKNSAFRDKKIIVVAGKHLDAASHYAAQGVVDLVNLIFRAENNADR
ncbi:MAG: ABC transporter substrate-binding protein [Candidatus Dadabacteria bacterium]|nr:ABC transporter substrate-binding protein [Candidatus Dadabacteria bacterium]